MYGLTSTACLYNTATTVRSIFVKTIGDVVRPKGRDIYSYVTPSTKNLNNFAWGYAGMRWCQHLEALLDNTVV